MGKTVRSIFIFASVLTACAMTTSALADPILECGLLVGENLAVGDCLRTQLDISYRAMIEAKELALGTAHQLDEGTGTEVAVLGLESCSRHGRPIATSSVRPSACSPGMRRRRRRRSSPVRSGSLARVPTPCCACRAGAAEPPHCRAQILVHRLEQLPQDDGRHLDGYPLRAIPVHPPAADHIPSSAGRCRGVG